MKRIIFAGGGTGGHLFPAFALAEEFKKRLGNELETRFFVTGRPLEMKLINERGFSTTRIHVRGIRRGSIAANFLFPIILLFGIIEALLFVIRFSPDMVIGTGGYLSFPAILAGKLANRPAFIQEQNSYAGVATRRAARFADLIFIAYEAAAKDLKFLEKCVLAGNPVNRRFGEIEKNAALSKFGLDSNKNTLLIVGGSQGARSINRKIESMLPEFAAAQNLQLIWQTGDDHAANEAFAQSGAAGLSENFIEDMPSVYAAADLVICRGGALTLSELAASGKPAIIIPYPHATDDHQTRNAEALVQAGAAELVRDYELDNTDLYARIKAILTDDKKLMTMSLASSQLGVRGAAEAIVQRIFEYMGWR